MTDLASAERDVLVEAETAIWKNGNYRSPHEGYGVLLEEVDEVWDEVKKKRAVRDPALMYEEAKHVAACAIRFMVAFGP